MTVSPAYASFAEDEIGAVIPGRRADLVVLDSDIMTVPLAHILKTKVLGTILDGTLVYGKLS